MARSMTEWRRGILLSTCQEQHSNQHRADGLASLTHDCAVDLQQHRQMRHLGLSRLARTGCMWPSIAQPTSRPIDASPRAASGAELQEAF